MKRPDYSFPMFEVNIIVRDENALKGMGSHFFRVLPRVGDHIEMNIKEGDDRIGYWYEVIGVVHPAEIAGHCGDLLVLRRGRSGVVQKAIFDGATG